jgi:hypothetical protein
MILFAYSPGTPGPAVSARPRHGHRTARRSPGVRACAPSSPGDVGTAWPQAA